VVVYGTPNEPKRGRRTRTSTDSVIDVRRSRKSISSRPSMGREGISLIAKKKWFRMNMSGKGVKTEE